MKPKSKLLSLLLAICLVAGLMPTAALAAGTDTFKYYAYLSNAVDEWILAKSSAR